MPPLIDVSQLRIDFPGPGGSARTAVDGVSFELADGDTLALVGESGCGKTQTALALLRLSPPGARVTAQRLSVAGEDVLGADAATIERLRGGVVGLVMQEPAQALNPVLSIGAQVGEAARLHLGLAPAAARRLAAELLAEVGLEDPAGFVNAYPHQLSGGQRQRVLIAAALAGQPRLLVADEPASALDAIAGQHLIALLERLHETRGLGLIVISHDLPLVARAVSWVAVVYAGETVELARREDLFGRPAHPYTVALADMVPRRGRRRRRPLPAIPGQVTPPDPRAHSCRFAPRCPMAFARCREARPALVPIERGRLVRCFLFSSAEHGDA